MLIFHRYYQSRHKRHLFILPFIEYHTDGGLFFGWLVWRIGWTWKDSHIDHVNVEKITKE